MHSQCIQRSSQREYYSNFKVIEWFTEEWSLITYYSERLQSVSFNIRRSESEEEFINRAVNINNKWIIALSVFTAELSYIKISVSMQHHKSDVKQLKYYLIIN